MRVGPVNQTSGAGIRRRFTARDAAKAVAMILLIAGLWALVLPGQAMADPLRPNGLLDLPGHAAIKYSPPTLVDINGDGRPEILVGTDDGKVVAATYSNGGLRLLWSYDTSQALGGATAIRGAVSVADLDGDGTMEIVAPVGEVFAENPGMPGARNTMGGIVVLNAQGRQLWHYVTYDHTGTGLRPDGYSDGVVGAPALGDLNNDGFLEIVFGSFDHRVYVFRHDGTLMPGWPQFVRDTVWTSPALADLNGDGLLEIIIGIDTHVEGPPFNTPNGGAIYVYRADGSLFPGWPQFIHQVIFSSPAIGDLDGDGRPEIIHGTGDFFQGNVDAGYRIYVWNTDGTLKWSARTDGFVHSAPALADLTGDGKLEIVAYGAGAKRVYAWRHNGSELWSQVPTNFQGNSNPVPLIGSPIIAAYTTNQPMVYANVLWDSVILDGRNGAQLTASRFPGDSRPGYVSGYTTADNAAAVGDLDGDGKLELVLASADNSGRQGQIAFWRLPAAATPANMPWPMFGRDPAHTNWYRPTPGFDARVVGHSLPEVLLEGETRQVEITLRNTGQSAWSPGQVYLGAVGSAGPLSSRNQIALSRTVPPGESITFQLPLTAPNTPGYYITAWRLHAGGAAFGPLVTEKVKVSNQPALHVLTAGGIFAGGLAAPLPGAHLAGDGAQFTNWPAARILKLVNNKRGYYMMDDYGGFWRGGDIFPLPNRGWQPDPQDFAPGPDGITYWVLLGDGTLYGCNTDHCDKSFNPATPRGIAARSLALTRDGHGVYVVDGYGGVYTGGNAPALALPNGLPLGYDGIVRIKLTPDGRGYYLLERSGRLWLGGNAPELAPKYAIRNGEDWARDFELTDDGLGYYLLDRFGAIHAGGAAAELTYTPPPTGDSNHARDLELVDTRRRMGPGLALTPGEVRVLAARGANSGQTTQLTLRNTGTDPFTWNAELGGGTAGNLLRVSPDRGTLAPGQSVVLSVSTVDLKSLPKGNHQHTLSVLASVAQVQADQSATIIVRVVDRVYRTALPTLLR